MADEIALTTDSSSESPCVLVWETSTWMQIRAYKQGVCSKKCLCHLTQNYILAGQLNKPLVHVWDFGKEQMHSKMICPGNLSALSVSPNGSFCAGACSEKIYIWQVSTGNLLCILSRHFQPVTCLKFTDDSSHLISAGDDNLVLVWPLVRVLTISSYQIEEVSPKHTWSDHSLPVTSLHVGHGGVYCRVVSASLDHTCKLWDMASGDLLSSFVFNVAILSVVMDSAEYRLFAGGFDGKIYVINMFSQQPVNDNIEEDKECFLRHSKQVTSLSLSMDGSLLLSGSKDCTARVWDVASKQCLRVLDHKGCVDNVQILLRSPNLDGQHSKSSLPVLGTLKRSVQSFSETPSSSQQQPGSDHVPIRICNIEALEAYKQRESHEFDLLKSVVKENCGDEPQNDGQVKLTNAELVEELKKSKELNQTLYHFAVDEILNEASNGRVHKTHNNNIN